MFNKKGTSVGRDSVVNLILALAVLVVLVGLFYVVFVEKEDVFTRKICQISVYLSDQTVGIFQKLGIGGVYCKTYYKEFEDMKKDEFLNKIAENMRQCWWMWGEGERDPAGENLVKWSDYQCFNCYVIEPLGDVPEITIEDLESYLIDEYIGDSDTNYWNYFKGFNNNGIIFNFPSIRNSGGSLFENGKLYSVTFVENTQPNVLSRMMFVSVGTTSCLVPGIGTLVCGISLVAIPVVGIETALENFLVGYFSGDEDGIMISEFDDNKKVCSGEIG